MAQKRLLDRKITTSERVNDLSLLGIVIYTWAIPVSDDFGLLQGSPRTIKGQVLPMLDVATKEVSEAISKILDSHLWEEFIFNGKNYYHIVNFFENQKLRQDMQPFTILPIELEKDYAQSWSKCNEIITKHTNFGRIRTSSDDFGTEVKIIEDNIREDNIIEKEIYKEKESSVSKETFFSHLEDLSIKDFEEIAIKYQVPYSFVMSQYEDMCLWAGQRPGNKKIQNRNWKLTLMAWVKREGFKIKTKHMGDPTKRGIDASKL